MATRVWNPSLWSVALGNWPTGEHKQPLIGAKDGAERTFTAKRRPFHGSFRLQYWQKLIRMLVEPQVTIPSHVHGNLRALRLTKSITQFEEPVSLPHTTPILSSSSAFTKRGPYTGLPVSRRNGSATPRLLTAPFLRGERGWGGGVGGNPWRSDVSYMSNLHQ